MNSDNQTNSTEVFVENTMTLDMVYDWEEPTSSHDQTSMPNMRLGVGWPVDGAL
jgi:hypothetical protein